MWSVIEWTEHALKSCTLKLRVELAPHSIPSIHTSLFIIRVLWLKSVNELLSMEQKTSHRAFLHWHLRVHARAIFQYRTRFGAWRASRVSSWKVRMPSCIIGLIKFPSLMPISVRFGVQSPRQLNDWTRTWEARPVSVTAIPKDVRFCSGFFDKNMINLTFYWYAKYSLYSVYASSIHAKNLHHVHRSLCRSVCANSWYNLIFRKPTISLLQPKKSEQQVTFEVGVQKVSNAK